MSFFLVAGRLLAGAALMLAAACHPNATSTAPPAGQLMHSGFEESLGWGGAAAGSLTTARAHTGQLAVLASPQVPFSYTFGRTLAELGLGGGAHQLELTGYALRTAAGSTARLVVQLDASATDQRQVMYQSLPLAEAVPAFGEWQPVRLPVALPAQAQGGNLLKVYLWNDKGTSPTYLDDVTLTRLDK